VRLALTTCAGLATALVVMAACSDSKTVGSATTVAAATSTSVAETASTTGATTVVAEATTSTSSTPVTSTTVAAAVELLLSDSGIGPFSLGDGAQPVIDGISLQLGAPTRDESVDYPVADGHGAYTTTDGDIGFVAPMGRTVCWSINLCGEFGGGNAASMSFTGWTYTNDPSAALSSQSGGTVGALWSDLPALDVDEGGCYSVGSGSIDGIRVVLESTGDPFSSFDDSGNYVVNSPDPADVRVTWLEAGTSPIFLHGDC